MASASRREGMPSTAHAGALILVSLLTISQSAHAAPPAVTYYKHIAPILFEYCAPCHRPGELGPFSLLTYEDAHKRAGLIAAVTRRRYMPPWLPEPGHGDFANERRLTEAQIEQIGKWASSGAPEGSRADSPPAPKFTPGWQLGTPDVVLQVSKPFHVPADGPDLFWNFILTPNIREMRYVRGIEIRPGAARSVHHANVEVDPGHSSRHREKMPGEGFPGMEISIERPTFDPDSHFLFWKPGAVLRSEPDGMAWKLNPGSDLVLNVHFHPTGKPELVTPSIGLYFTDKPPTKTPMLVQMERDSQLDIPAGTRDFLISDDFRLPVDLDVLAVYPHAHYLGTLLEAFATLPDGSRQWLIRIPRWDINWQAVFQYRKPVFLPKGTTVSMRFHYDNSADNPRNPNSPPDRVMSGNQSTDEMGHLWLQALPRGDSDQRGVLLEAIMRHRLENDPANAAAHFNLGVLLLRRKDTANGIAQLQDALRLDPEQPMALNDLGVALQAEGKLAEAVEQFQHALRTEPDFTSARFNLGNALAVEGKLEEAAANYRQVIAAEPGDAAARKQLIALLIRSGNEAVAQGQLATATASYRELVTLQPGDADLHANFGTLLARSGDLAGAAAEFEAALKINPAHPTARRNLEIIRNHPPAK
jgi:tetratricopeptide (TPR) repeat protein